MKEKGATVVIAEAGDGWVTVRFPYDEDFIDEMKDAIVGAFRRWDPDNRVWFVHASFLTELLQICHRYFEEVKVDSGVAAYQEDIEADGIFKHLFSFISEDYIDKIYKALAQAFHPDHQGDPELMKQLNNAYEDRKAHKTPEIIEGTED